MFLQLSHVVHASIRRVAVGHEPRDQLSLPGREVARRRPGQFAAEHSIIGESSMHSDSLKDESKCVTFSQSGHRRQGSLF